MMNKIELNKLDLTVYHEKIDNGLNIYVLPKTNVNNIYVTFTTNFGSNEVEFVPIGEQKMIKVPLGIAHFLEHKMFEQENGEDPFKFFGERGSDANANTNNFKTTYLFSGPEFFEDNINFLLDYVQSPYFTDENVDKEKGIIEQEIKMYQDDPYSVLYERILKNSLIRNPMKDPVIGNTKSVRSITKEHLYKCYNTFYHPSNMFVVVTGNVDPKLVIDTVKKNQSEKEFPSEEKIEIKSFTEPDKVSKEKEVITMGVTVPKVSVNYKINYNKIKDISPRKVKQYLSMLFCIKFDSTSMFNEILREKQIVTDMAEVSSIDTLSHVIYTIVGETNNGEDFIKAVRAEMMNLEVSEDDFERKKKSIIGSLLFMSDNIFRLNSKIMNDLNRYQEIISDNYGEIKDLNIKEFKKVIQSIDFSNNNIVIIKPKDV